MSNIIPDNKFQPAVNQSPVFVPEDKFESYEDKYGSLPQAAIAGVEGVARGLTLGTSDYVAGKLSSPEAVRARQEVNPTASIGGNIAGGAGLIGLTGGLAAPAEAALAGSVAPTAARALGFAAEGAMFGAANTISDLALGDTNVNAEKVLMDIGLGAALGGGLGLLSKGLEALPSLRKAAPALEDVKPTEPPSGGTPPIESEIPTPDSLKKMQEGIENFKYMGQNLDAPLPRAEVVAQAVERLPDLQIKPTEMHLENLDPTKQVRNEAILKQSHEGEDVFNKWSNGMRNELANKTESTIEQISPDHEVSTIPEENGEYAKKALEDSYEAKKDELKPAYKAIEKLETAEPGSHQWPLIDIFTQLFPKAAEAFDTSTGVLKIGERPTGIASEAWDAMKEVVERSKKIASIQDLKDLRSEVSMKITPTMNNSARGQLETLAASMTDYIQGQIDKAVGAGGEALPMSFRDALKGWAINEKNISQAAKAFGFNIVRGEFESGVSKPASTMLTKMFKNEESVRLLKSIVTPKEFNNLTKRYLAQMRDVITKDGVISSAKFGTFLNKNGAALREALPPETLQRLLDLNTVQRLVPDLPMANSSKSAYSLWEMVKKAGSAHGILGALEEKLTSVLKTSQANSQFDAVMSGRAEQAEKMGVIQKIIKKSTDKIDKATEAVFSGAARGAFFSGATKAISGDYSERVKQVKELNDPSAMMDHFQKSTGAMQSAAPNITQSLNQAMVRATEFLNSKIPAPHNQFVLSNEYKPSAAAKDRFNHYYNVVHDPLLALDELRFGILTSDTMEALKTVHPNLLVEMQKGIMSHFDEETAKKLPYSTKMSLSTFLGQPLDEHMTPQSVIGYQVSLGMPQQSQQGVQSDRVTQAGLKKLDLAKTSKTQTDPQDES